MSMKLYLQFGYGMIEHCRTMLSRWGGGAAIVSPRDLTAVQLPRVAEMVRNTNSQVLVDPQFYVPNADHERLCSHDYWPSAYETGTFWQGPELRKLVSDLKSLNDFLQTSAFILPGMLASTIDEDWLGIQQSVLEEATKIESSRPLMMTVALSSEAIRDENQIGNLLERAEHWKVGAYYVVLEHPNGDYLVADPNWIANAIDLAAGLRLLGVPVLLGYCTHQMLLATLAKTTAIASGTWMNVRSFPPAKFVTAYEDEMKQRATWYYCPQALSEYKVPFLDIAWRRGMLDQMRPALTFDGGFVEDLFSGAQPTSVGFTETEAFRHYLHALHEQSALATKATFDETVDGHRNVLDGAETLIQQLTSSGVRGLLRDFREIVDVNRAALELFVSLRGAILRRRWSSL
jgi:hypothetical protein